MYWGKRWSFGRWGRRAQFDLAQIRKDFLICTEF